MVARLEHELAPAAGAPVPRPLAVRQPHRAVWTDHPVTGQARNPVSTVRMNSRASALGAICAFVAFESLPGKVQRINLKIAPDLGEPEGSEPG